MTAETPACRLCGSADAALVWPTVSAAPSSKVYRCGACGVVYLHPIMTEAEERAMYEGGFPAYMEARGMPGGADPAAHFEAHRRGEGARRLALIREFLRPTDDVAEIGSATGYLLDLARPLVRSVTGVEPGRAFAEFAAARGIPTKASIDDLPAGGFDVVLLYYVLEHMRDPVGFARRLGGLLKPGGRLLLEVPNHDDPLVSLYEIPALKDFYYQKVHYWYFDRLALAGVLERAGFAPEIRTTQRYDLSNHIWWMTKGRPGGQGKFDHVFDAGLKAAYAAAIERAGLGDALFGIARRPLSHIGGG